MKLKKSQVRRLLELIEDEFCVELEDSYWHCDKCCYYSESKYHHYCPNCGDKMDFVDESGHAVQAFIELVKKAKED